jgi:hypothetical protein
MRLRVLSALLLVSLPASPALAGPFRVGASVDWSRSELGSGIGVWVLLELPLDRAVRPVVPRGAELSEDAAPPAPAPPVVKPALRRPIADSALAQAAVRAARRERAVELRRARLDGLATRARASATLPQLVLRAARSTDQSLRLSPTANDVTVYDYTHTGGADLLLEARATWTLDRLVFASEELGVERLRLEHDRAEERLVDRVLSLVFAWERAGRRLAAPETEPEARERAAEELLEAEATLDVLTGGWFGAEIARRRRAP